MSLILWVLGILFAIGLIITLLRLVFRLVGFLLGLAIIVAVGYGLFKLVVLLWHNFGWWTIVAPIAILFVLAIIGAIIQAFQPPLEKLVAEVFREVEMATKSEVMARLSKKVSVDVAKLEQVIQKYIADGMLETVDFPHKERVFRWTEKRNYPNGVVVNEIHLD